MANIKQAAERISERERLLREALERIQSISRIAFLRAAAMGNNLAVVLAKDVAEEAAAALAARASTPPDVNTSWFCVPCGFTTRDAAEAQAHLGPHMIELTCPFDGQIWRFHTQAQADMLQKHLDWHAAQPPTPTTEAR